MDALCQPNNEMVVGLVLTSDWEVQVRRLFEYLGPIELMTAATMCRRWRELADEVGSMKEESRLYVGLPEMITV